MNDDQFTQILRAINDVRGDVRDLKDDVKNFKDEMNKRWDENDRRWEENNKRWEENDRRWEENNKKWAANEKALNLIRQQIKRNYKGLFVVFDGYETAVENMYQENKQRIMAIEKRLKVAHA